MSGRRLLTAALAVVALLCAAVFVRAEVVSNLGTLTVGRAETIGCNTATCVATTGSVGGSLPTNTAGPDPFQHQIVFQVSTDVTGFASTQVLDSLAIDVANLTVSLYEFVAGSSAVGGTAVGLLLATAAKSTFGSTTNFFLTAGALDPLKTYFIEIFGGGQGVLKDNASYTQQVVQLRDGGGPGPGPSPVPLPAPFMLLALALGALGLGRWWHRRRVAAV
jgi:hypothetical protein